MIRVVLTLAAVFSLLVLAEVLWRKKILRGENARKFMHITGGVYGAFWPLYLSWRQIQLIALIGVTFILIMRKLRLFPSMYDIKRRSWGDLLGPLMLGIIIFLQLPTPIFIAAILHLAIADGFAAVIGTRYGKRNQYKVMGYTKSVAGTMTFFVLSVLITIGTLLFSNVVSGNAAWLALVILPVVTTLVENIAVYGVDNVFIPLAIVVILSLLKN